MLDFLSKYYLTWNGINWLLERETLFFGCHWMGWLSLRWPIGRPRRQRSDSARPRDSLMRIAEILSRNCILHLLNLLGLLSYIAYFFLQISMNRCFKEYYFLKWFTNRYFFKKDFSNCLQIDSLKNNIFSIGLCLDR